MRKFLSLLLVCLLILSIGLSGCAPKLGGNDYDSRTARTAQTVEYGTVASVRVVHINADDSANVGLGTVGGGVAGGALGSLLGGGAGRVLFAAGGAALGAGLGYLGAKKLSGQDGYEIMVKMDDGRTLAIVQGADITFQAGDRVRVLSDGHNARVTHPN